MMKKIYKMKYQKIFKDQISNKNILINFRIEQGKLMRNKIM